MTDRNAGYSDLVEIAKRNGEFRKHWGLVLGSILYCLSVRATRPRIILWSGMIGLATVVGGLVLRY